MSERSLAYIMIGTWVALFGLRLATPRKKEPWTFERFMTAMLNLAGIVAMWWLAVDVL